MEILKLNKRFVLGKNGFNYAIRFRSYYNKRAIKAASTLRQMHGDEWAYSIWIRRSSDSYMWGTYLNSKSREYYIGVKNEADLTAVILSMENV